MPNFATYRRFPHKDSRISTAAKYNVFVSQLHRFAAICSGWPQFRLNVRRLLSEIDHTRIRLAPTTSDAALVWAKYAAIQMRVHRHNIRNARKLFSLLTRECGKLSRALLTQA